MSRQHIAAKQHLEFQAIVKEESINDPRSLQPGWHRSRIIVLQFSAEVDSHHWLTEMSVKGTANTFMLPVLFGEVRCIVGVEVASGQHGCQKFAILSC